MKNNMRIQLVPNLKLEQKQKYNSTQEKYLKIYLHPMKNYINTY